MGSFINTSRLFSFMQSYPSKSCIFSFCVPVSIVGLFSVWYLDYPREKLITPTDVFTIWYGRAYSAVHVL